VKQSEYQYFYSDLADLLSAGITLPAALKKVLSRQQTGISKMDEIRPALHSGDIVGAFKKLALPGRDARILKAGHTGGNMVEACRNLADLYKQWDEMMGKTFFIGIWFFFTGLVACFVISVFAYISGGSRAALTALVLTTGGWTFITVHGFKNFKKLISGASAKQGSLFLRLPLFKNVFTHLQHFLLYFQWQLMYEAGLSLSEIFSNLSADFPDYSSVLELARYKTATGTDLNSLPHLKEILSARDYERLTVGEQSGKLDEVLAQLKDIHRARLEQLVENLPRILLLAFYLLLIPVVAGIVIYFWITYFSFVSSITSM